MHHYLPNVIAKILTKYSLYLPLVEQTDKTHTIGSDNVGLV